MYCKRRKSSAKFPYRKTRNRLYACHCIAGNGPQVTGQPISDISCNNSATVHRMRMQSSALDSSRSQLCNDTSTGVVRHQITKWRRLQKVVSYDVLHHRAGRCKVAMRWWYVQTPNNPNTKTRKSQSAKCGALFCRANQGRTKRKRRRCLPPVMHLARTCIRECPADPDRHHFVNSPPLMISDALIYCKPKGTPQMEGIWPGWVKPILKPQPATEKMVNRPHPGQETSGMFAQLAPLNWSGVHAKITVQTDVSQCGPTPGTHLMVKFPTTAGVNAYGAVKSPVI